MQEYIRDIDKGLLFEYKKILLGNSQKFPLETFSRNDYRNQEVALKFFKFAVEIFLRWTPEMTREMMDADTIEKMKLGSVFAHINYPSELDKEKDYWYIACLLYPHKFPYDEVANVIDVYDDILNAIEDGGKYKFPKNFFAGIKGRDRACICLRRYVERYEIFHDVREMYEYFSSSAGTKALDDHGLKLVWKTIFESPVEYLHMSLSDDDKDDFLYHYYTFQWTYRKAKKASAELDFIERLLNQ